MLNMTSQSKKKLKKDEAHRKQHRKDDLISKQEKDEIKRKCQEERDKWDLSICTGYVRVFPSLDAQKQ